MSRNSSNGEVFGSKVLNFAIIVTSAFLLAGVFWTPATHSAGAQTKPAIEDVVVTAPSANRVAG